MTRPRKSKTAKDSGGTAESFGVRLDRLMTERGLTVRAAATAAGVSQSTLQNWRSGHLPTDFPAVRRLAEALGTTLAFMLTGEADGAPAIGDVLLDGGEVFDGFLEVKIRRLIPRQPMKKGTAQ